MKVLLLNASPHKEGCTYTALKIILDELNKEGIEGEIFYAGANVLPCKACYACSKLGRCVIENDKVNEFVEKAASADGFIFGSPVHYASASAILSSFLDRAFFSAAKSGKNVFRLKPAAAVVSARRAGTTATIDEINKYFAISEMPIISSRYWNMVHGNSPDEVLKDAEGVQIMKILAKNMAYYLKLREAGLKLGIKEPEKETATMTNFIR